MSEQNFFERWSRLKRQAAEEREKEAPPEAAASESATEQSPEKKDVSAPAVEEPPFDPASLPPIESITSASDIRAFLAPGVPATLTRAALRRAWVADPTIRDFVGLSENAWDFTAPESIPGFGSIGGAEELRRLVAQLTGEHSPLTPEAPEKTADVNPTSNAAQLRQDSGADPVRRSDDADASQEEAAPAETATDLLQHNKEDAASQHQSSNSEDTTASIRRSHGGALPE